MTSKTSTNKKLNAANKSENISIKDERGVIVLDALMNIILETRGAKGYLLRNIPPGKIESYELWERLHDADDTIRYLTDFIIKYHTDFPLIAVCENSKSEIDRLYKAIKKAARKNKTSIEGLAKGLMKEAVYKEYDDNIQSFKFVKREHLDIIYEFSGGQMKRDFRDALIRKIIKETEINVKNLQNKISCYYEKQ
jgi:hypothetical protein